MLQNFTIFYSIYIGNKLKAKCTVDALDTWLNSLEKSKVDLNNVVVKVETKYWDIENFPSEDEF